MSNESAVEVREAAEAAVPEEWREHVRELRAENARRRKENQELRAALAALEGRAAESEAARSAEAELARRELASLAAARRRLKLIELGRATRAALDEAAARLQNPTAEGGCGRRVVDMAKALRLLERVPSPVDIERDLMVDAEGGVELESDAARRLDAYCGEIAELASHESPAAGEMPAPLAGTGGTGVPPVASAGRMPAAPPPVGGEPPRGAGGRARLANCWDPECQPSASGRAQAALRETARAHARELEELGAI